MGKKKNNEQKADAKSVSQPIAKPFVIGNQSQLTVLIDEEIKKHLDNNKEIETVSANGFYVVENDVRRPDLWKPYTGKNFKDKQC